MCTRHKTFNRETSICNWQKFTLFPRLKALLSGYPCFFHPPVQVPDVSDVNHVLTVEQQVATGRGQHHMLEVIECGMMNVNSQGQRRIRLQKVMFFWKPSKLDLTSFLLVKYVANFTGDFIKKTRPNWARKVRELILFNILCTVYCGRGCLSLESEGKE